VAIGKTTDRAQKDRFNKVAVWIISQLRGTLERRASNSKQSTVRDDRALSCKTITAVIEWGEAMPLYSASKLVVEMEAKPHSRGEHSARIIAKFERIIAAKPSEAIYLSEMCAAIGVAERTLRDLCRRQFGMSPIRYMWMKRMNLVRTTLMKAKPSNATVTEVATTHGFYELGRFSVEYRTLFGESPSVTLQRGSERNSDNGSAPDAPVFQAAAE
jgi:transcriptional regulator GlxA family with amidase domain